jgi:hypothetical protein
VKSPARLVEAIASTVIAERNVIRDMMKETQFVGEERCTWSRQLTQNKMNRDGLFDD